MRPTHSNLCQSHWLALRARREEKSKIIVDGQTLTLADLIAVSCYRADVTLTNDVHVLQDIDQSIAVLEKQLNDGRTIYGVTTGYGGSADVRTKDTSSLQSSLVQHLNVGILLPSEKGQVSPDEKQGSASHYQAFKPHALPDSVVRGMMLVRCNSLVRGHSGVRVQVINTILQLLMNGATPVIPLRGSISASGDLSSLSYIAGALEGNPDIYMRLSKGTPQVMSADQALKHLQLEPLKLQAKEGLGITNGTGASTSAAALALHEAHHLAILAQILTAMSTEAMLGRKQNYAPFISACRPHTGQTEVASNILGLLTGSKLVSAEGPYDVGLAQDRYPLRTAPQWLGPLLENLVLADHQLCTELNSTTDNPLIDILDETVYHGGNFQAASVTSAMEKVASSMQLMGKLIFAQCSEILDSNLNKNLPPNLAADDPSTSFTMKGFDVNMGAYMSELAYIANPISTHVQSAEMNNQSVNSLALISSRIALESVEVLSLMSATFLYVLCQALDLRCLQLEFEMVASPVIRDLTSDCFKDFVPAQAIEHFCGIVCNEVIARWLAARHFDLEDRGLQAARESSSVVMQEVGKLYNAESSRNAGDLVLAFERFCDRVGRKISELYSQTRNQFLAKPSTPSYLGTASQLMYDFVRHKLAIPMHRGLADHPPLVAAKYGNEKAGKILGSMAADIYVSIRDGRMHDVLMASMETVHFA
ncbi:Phenylalanine aminomutase (L-beta-phenylalanine forming) [Paramyrothecium foliicola]|nr:Phenylalanine aminomutase (L-beta-phenylalanine forming) [Paramyrothecium foliicola]